MKRYLFFACFCLISVGLFGQSGLHLGFGGMPQQTWMINKTDSEIDQASFRYVPTFGVAGTVKIGYNFGPPLGVHTGLVWSKQGQRNSFVDSTGSTGERYREMTYLKIPLFLHISSATGGRNERPVLFSMGAGVQYGMLQAVTVTENGLPMNVDSLSPSGLTDLDTYSSEEISFAWYLGADIRVSEPMYLNIHLRSDYTFGDAEEKLTMVNGERWWPAGRSVTNNFNWGINVGLTFVIDVSSGGGKGGQFWFR